MKIDVILINSEVDGRISSYVVVKKDISCRSGNKPNKLHMIK